MRTRLFRVAEITLGCCLAIALAAGLGLQNSVSAGIITILSISETKRETLRSGMQRLLSFALAIAIAYAAFSLLGYGLLAFGVYFFAYALCLYTLRLQSSLPICTVLISHFWLAGHMEPWLIANEGLLMLIGSGIGIALNLFLPRNVDEIRAAQRRIEDILRACFLHLSLALAEPAADAPIEDDLDTLHETLQAAEASAQILQGNTLRSDVTYYLQYIDMRRRQYRILRRIADTAGDLPYLPAQAQSLSRFMWRIAQSLHEHNNAVALLNGLQALRDDYQHAPLPQTRSEFEARALLYRIMIDTEYFLLLKKNFIASLTEAQRKTFGG